MYFNLFSRHLFISWGILLLDLSCGIFHGSDRGDCMFGLHCWFLLRNCGSYGSDGSLRRGLVLGRVSNGLLELFIGNIFVVSLHIKLLKLYCGIFFSIFWRDFMHELLWRILLNDYRQDFRMYFNLFSRHLFSSWGIFVH